MSNPPNQEAIQNLIQARATSYSAAFTTLSAADISSWQSQDLEFNDITMDEYRMSHPTTQSFFTTACQSMASLKVLQDVTHGTTPDFVVWEMLLEVTYNVDEPKMGIKKGQKGLVRGGSLQWWRWEGEGDWWDGDLGEKGMRKWKIVRENDYMVTLKDGAVGGAERIF